MARANKWYFLELWERIDSRGSKERYELYGRIELAYGSRRRQYHTLAHIEHCLREFDEVKHLAHNPDAVELALWLHDVLYRAQAHDNEEKSAEFALGALRETGAPKSFAQEVAGLILATKHMRAPLATHDMRLMVDIDLSIFGQSKERFDEYERQIREEHGHMLPAEFVSYWTAILASFLEHRPLYSTQFFRDKYEERARQNLERSVTRLARG